MRLLVSVRSAAEVEPAIAGGAEIIDAKEPSLGSLGAVSPATLRAIAAALPPGVSLSVALGDPADAAAIGRGIGALDGLGARARETFVKLGLAAVGSVSSAEELAVAAVAAASHSTAHPAVILVAYADATAAGAPAREQVVRLAARAGARGVLLDTWAKDGRDLFHHVDDDALRRWVLDAKRAGLLVALAGSLSAEGVRRLAHLPADVVGVRGAACRGGREGGLEEERVRRLRTVLDSRGHRPEAIV
jgi:uncharacterized protein (UPF0264 family)